ncbi:amidohydrolase family protein [Rhodococcus erythropolis]
MAEFDLVIRGGTVVDGDGKEPFTADVAVKNGLIAKIGAVSGRGTQEIDADGAIVSPGFVDVHTHYDGQATWDERLQPSSWHGVTTVVAGNCGVGFAPVKPSDHQRLIELMEGVEDIPGVTLTAGMTWEWESYPDFLNFLETRTYDIDLATQIPHAALRVYAMGGRAAARETATEVEITEMARLAKEAIESGALGFSTSRTLNHKSTDGTLSPDYAAGHEELVAIARAIGETGSGVLQVVSDDFLDPFADTEHSSGRAELVDAADEIALIERMAEVSGRPLSFSLTQNRNQPRFYREILDELERLNAAGHQVRAQVAARAVGLIHGLECTLHPFMTNPVWQEISHLTPTKQAEAMASPEMRRRILEATPGKGNGTVLGGLRIERWDTMFELENQPDYEPHPEQSIAARAHKMRRAPIDLAYEILISDQGRGKLYQPFANYSFGSLDAVHEMLEHPFTIPGLSDGGAHVGTVCDGSFPTTLLQYWVRDRQDGRLTLPFVVQRQARDTARAVGLHDRGRIALGLRADMNVIDLDALRLHKPEMTYDLPANGRRLLQRADGYRHTFVSGIETYRNGESTGALPGRLIRGGRPSPTTQ